MNATTRFRLGTLSILLLITTAGIILWPLPALGFVPDLVTGVVTNFYANSPAAQAGVREGDRIIAIYNYPWESINTRLLLLPLPWSPGTSTPLIVERAGTAQTLVINAGSPTPALQL